jgi:hypothetical protein
MDELCSGAFWRVLFSMNFVDRRKKEREFGSEIYLNRVMLTLTIYVEGGCVRKAGYFKPINLD